MSRLTSEDGTHAATFNPALTLFADVNSSVTRPPRTTLFAADGTSRRFLHQSNTTTLDEFELSRPEFMQVKTRDGFVMEAMMLKPANFDPAKKYPVFQHTYSGPHAPSVRNAWGGSTYMFHQFLAQNGFIVWICDNRTASGKGAASAWPSYRKFGQLELSDLEDGIRWLKQQPYVDAAHVTLSGWSFGGFMTTYAMTHSKEWSGGIAGGSVTDWRDYDTVYTERYMLTPEHNEAGYRDQAPRFAAANLSGKLLLLHGTTDDNVHVQNTIQFAWELQKANKQFEMMLYPRSRHGVVEPHLVRHMRGLMFDFLVRTSK
jgi:dipeptidyl-peptidase-4